ncbi:MAG: sigma-70 family RNA polymerase sigma factor [Gammaproteobacteria bacterium]
MLESPTTGPADTQALHAECARCRTTLYRIALLQLRDHHAAEDAVQETLVAAIEGRAGFRGQSSIKTWLLAILRFKIIDSLRARGSGPLSRGVETEAEPGEFDALFDGDGNWAEPKSHWRGPEGDYEEIEFFRVLEACMERLPEATARVFRMREFLELETPEICERARVSAGNARALLYRARMSLRVCLGKSWYEGGDAAAVRTRGHTR